MPGVKPPKKHVYALNGFNALRPRMKWRLQSHCSEQGSWRHRLMVIFTECGITIIAPAATTAPIVTAVVAVVDAAAEVAADAEADLPVGAYK